MKSAKRFGPFPSVARSAPAPDGTVPGGLSLLPPERGPESIK